LMLLRQCFGSTFATTFNLGIRCDFCIAKAINPSSRTGAKARTSILTVSWVFGEQGKNFVKTILNLASSRKELNIVADHGEGLLQLAI
ncbi:NAD(P)-dependent oxidoreductase, partial [Legionella pneumophila]|uniref:sugar nucleotide-binding protein n=1 Tax=Legionella pneumophila TaxID=446 RepID=UPI001FFA2A4D